MKPLIASLVTATILTGCAHDVEVAYPYATPASGIVEIVLNQPTSELTVTVNGDLVVDREHSRRARIVGVPAGVARVGVATGGRCEAGKTVEAEIEVTPGRATTLALPGPEPNTGCMIYSGLYYVGLNVGIAAIAISMLAAPRHVK